MAQHPDRTYLEADAARCRAVVQLFVDTIANARPTMTNDELVDLADALLARLMRRRCA